MAINFTIFFTITIAISLIAVVLAIIAVVYKNVMERRKLNSIDEVLIEEDINLDLGEESFPISPHDFSNLSSKYQTVVINGFNVESLVFSILCFENNIKDIQIVKKMTDVFNDVPIYLQEWMKYNFNAETFKDLNVFLPRSVKIIDIQNYEQHEECVTVNINNLFNNDVFQHFHKIFGNNIDNDDVFLFKNLSGIN